MKLERGAAVRVAVLPADPTLGVLAIESRASGTMVVDMTRAEAKDLISALAECWDVGPLELDDLTAGL